MLFFRDSYPNAELEAPVVLFKSVLIPVAVLYKPAAAPWPIVSPLTVKSLLNVFNPVMLWSVVKSTKFEVVAAEAAVTNAVVAKAVVLFPAVCVTPIVPVGNVGVPVNVGETKLAFKSNAACVAVETILSASEVFVTLPKPTIVGVIPLTVPVKVLFPAMVWSVVKSTPGVTTAAACHVAFPAPSVVKT